MKFIKACEEMANLVENSISDLVGEKKAGDFVKMGADGTPTKLIDKIAEDIIVEFLTSNNLCGKIISEELGNVVIGNGAGTVYLDPLDGTHNAISGIPFYAMSVAYAENGRVIKGYVKDLAHGETFYAIRGEGAYRNGEKIICSDTAFLKESTLSIYGRKFAPETIVGLGRHIRRWRLMGASALELCYVGCGRIDGFVDIRDTLRVTDAAAGMLICTEAGGIVTGKCGEPAIFSDLVSEGRCLIATNGIIHQKIIEYLG